MDLEGLREALRRQPFQPFTITTGTPELDGSQNESVQRTGAGRFAQSKIRTPSAAGSLSLTFSSAAWAQQP
jgi:hypothetical protein